MSGREGGRGGEHTHIHIHGVRCIVGVCTVVKGGPVAAAPCWWYADLAHSSGGTHCCSPRPAKAWCPCSTKKKNMETCSAGAPDAPWVHNSS
jgi:hypothetical protein